MNRIIRNTPYLEVICGPMFSGKSKELERRVSNIDYYNKANPYNTIRYIAFKPDVDTRSENTRKSYIDYSITDKYLRVNNAPIFWKLISDYDLIIFDEAQFYDDYLIKIIKVLLSNNKHIIVCGLDKDYLGEPFSELMKWTLCVSDEVIKLTALCASCGGPSTTAELLSKNDDLSNNVIIEDDNHKYVPKCRKCNHQLHKFYSKELSSIIEGDENDRLC